MNDKRAKLSKALEAVRTNTTPDTAAAFLAALSDSLTGGETVSKGAMCSVCHHRADKHWKEPHGFVAFCHHPRGGEFCGCVGIHAAADGDAKKGGEKRRREKKP